jgi:hypothetical protein
MKILLPFLVLFMLVSCRPLKTTKHYYEEYVRPTPTIDYEDTVSADIPVAFLDDYYTIDSKIVRLADQMDLVEARTDDAWIRFQKDVNPWVRHVAVLDNDLLFVSGDDALGFDPELRTALAGLAPGEKRTVLMRGGRAFFVHVASVAAGTLKTTAAEIDIPSLAADVPAGRTSLLVDGQATGPLPAAVVETLSKMDTKKYSGQIKLEGASWQWIRSMAADNLLYLYSN